MKKVFDFIEYKKYLSERVGGFRSRTGQRLALAKALKSQAAMISMVLNGNAHLTLEQAERANRFLGHSEEESDFFILLLQKDRAGTVELSAYWQKKISDFLGRRQEIMHRLGKRGELSKQDQGLYYSSWHYAAFHIAVSIPSLQTREALANHFRVPLRKLVTVMDQLIAMGLVIEIDGKYSYSSANLRLGRDSHNIIRHHANWRGQAVASLDNESPEDLHYSAVLSLSKAAQAKIRDLILENLKTQVAIAEDSPEEQIVGFCIDLFSLENR